MFECRLDNYIFSLVISFRRVLGNSPGHPDLLGGCRRLHRRGKAQAAKVRHQLLQTSAAGLQGEGVRMLNFTPFASSDFLPAGWYPPLTAGFPSSTAGSVPS